MDAAAECGRPFSTHPLTARSIIRHANPGMLWPPVSGGAFPPALGVEYHDSPFTFPSPLLFAVQSRLGRSIFPRGPFPFLPMLPPLPLLLPPPLPLLPLLLL